MLGGAIAAAGGYLGVKAFANGVDTLGRMSDVAMKASTSVDELTKASTGLSILGIQGMSIDKIAQSFAMMAKNTGKTGLSGFYEVIGEIGKISDVSKRSEVAMKVFGRSGLDFMPLINAAKNGTQSLQDLIGAMPKVPQAAADAGDKLSDAKTIGVEGFKNLWLEAIGSISKNIDENFEGGIRKASLDAVAYIGYFVKSTWADLTTWFARLGLMFQGFDNNIFNVVASFSAALVGSVKAVVNELNTLTQKATDSFGQSIGKTMYEWLNDSLGKDNANKFKHFLDEAGISDFVFGRNIENWRPPKAKEIKYDDTIPNIVQGIKDAFKKNLSDKVDWLAVGELESQNDAYQKELEETLAKQRELNKKAAEAYDNAAQSTGDRLLLDNQSVMGKGKNKIDNKLILGGSNEATKLALLGP